MFAAKLISDTVPPLRPDDSCSRALVWMDELRVNALPVIKGREYLGLLSKSLVVASGLTTATIEEGSFKLNRVFVYENQHVYDLTRLASLYKLDLVPVINEREEYSGLVTVNDLVAYFSESKSVYMPGGIIVLEVAMKDYSLSKISQLIESDGAHVLSAGISSTPDPQRIEVTIKIDKVDLSRILAALFRYDYNVVASYHQGEYPVEIKSRYQSLMHYLSI